ncbi:uncharacterized protein LOC135467054 [Liolophura sinensis]|uniref:uncharacterized protein LOC135467054 n=1 Tax=Liolophura sinensis TaxID=3198878 RepID=UPI0031590DC7
MSVYQQVSNSEKWNSVTWRYLKKVPENSTLRCGGQCLRMGNDCKAFAIYSHNYDYCVLLGGFAQLNHTVWMNPYGGWSVYHELNERLEMPVFRVSAGNGVSVYNSWLTGAPSSLSETSISRDLDLSSPLSDFYKHPLVDDWKNWGITEVIFSLYTNSHEVVRLRFSGSGTSKTSWFSLSNLLSSPWTDLDVNAEVNYFTISLENYKDHYRKFYINSHFGGCHVDEGWLLVLDGSDVCSWTFKTAYPTFHYALGSQMGRWADANQIGSADDLVISVLIQM